VDTRAAAYKKAAPDIPDAAFAKAIVDQLEGKINAGAHHAEVVFGAVDHVPAEIADPADMRSETDFNAAAELADCPSLGAVVGKIPVRLVKVCALAAAEDPTASAKNVRREPGTGNWITQGQGAQDGTDGAVTVSTIWERNRITVIISDKVTFGIYHPTLYTYAEVTVEKVFNIPATAPAVRILQIAVILPSVSWENVCAPEAHVKFLIRVPLWTWRRADLPYLLSRISLSAREGDGRDRGNAKQTQH
jgi:hypothetical protein